MMSDKLYYGIRGALVATLTMALLLLAVGAISFYSSIESGPSIAGYSVYGMGDDEMIDDGSDPDARSMLEMLSGAGAKETPSPCDRISESQIMVGSEMVVIDVKDAEWASFTDTNSMDPVIDASANAIQIVPKESSEICIGDIVSYQSSNINGVVIHRVVETGYDEDGWYAIMKGDNLNYRDPERVRFSQIKRVVIGIIY